MGKEANCLGYYTIRTAGCSTVAPLGTQISVDRMQNL